MDQSTEAKRTGDKRKRKPLEMPPPIPDTLENVAKAVLTTLPRKRSEWKFVQEHEGVVHDAAGQEKEA